MKTKLKTLGALALLPLMSATSPRPKSAEVSQKITGDYVEARTAAVFAGGCHYNGEVVTTGRDATMAWNFTGGNWKGTSLAGVRTMAIVTADDNFSNADAVRKTELLVDSSATSAQASAVRDLLETRTKADIGQIIRVRRGEISFSHVGSAYTVKSAGFASMDVQSMPDDACCKQPSLVWYTPLTPLTGRKVGYTVSATATPDIADPWQRQGENGAFYGALAF